MSITALELVFNHSTQTGSHLNVLVALAQRANDHGDGRQTAWPSLGELAFKCNVTKRQVRRILRDLETAGELLIQPGGGRGHTSKYTLLKGDKHVPLNDETKEDMPDLKGDMPGIKEDMPGHKRGHMCPPNNKEPKHEPKEPKERDARPHTCHPEPSEGTERIAKDLDTSIFTGPAKKPPAPPGIIPAYRVWVEAGLAQTIPKKQISRLDREVGRDPPALARFREVCEGWAGKGYNPRNVTDVIDCFKTGTIPGPNGSKPHAKTNRGSNQTNHIIKTADLATGREYYIDQRTGLEVSGPGG